MVYDNFCKLSSSLKCILVGTDLYGSQIGCNFHMRSAAEVDSPRCIESSRLACIQSKKKNYFFYIVVLFGSIFLFPFQ